jgi:hypothetical protein
MAMIGKVRRMYHRQENSLAKVWFGNLTGTFADLALASLDTAKQAQLASNLTHAVAAIRAALARLLLRVRGLIRILKDRLDLAGNTLWTRSNRPFSSWSTSPACDRSRT